MLAGLIDAYAKLGIVGTVGVRDPSSPCELFDGRHYDGRGDCYSDGHYLCVECSHLSPDAPRFNNDRMGRGDRLRLFWARPCSPHVLPQSSTKGE